MGRTLQKRIVRKLDLEMLLSRIPPHPKPDIRFEQYVTPPNIAANILHMAAYNYNSIIDKSVLDLGCGTGRLAIGAAFLGARKVFGVDIDAEAVRMAMQNAQKAIARERTQWIIADLKALHGRFDTVIENPPFGVQKRGADTHFLDKALELGNMVFSLHKTAADSSLEHKLKRGEVAQQSANPFLDNFIREHSARILGVYAMLMEVPHMFDFHTKKKHEFMVDLYVISTSARVNGQGL